MSTPPGKNVTHHDRDPALVATEQGLRYVVHDEAWTTFWSLDATYEAALKMKERIAGSRECRTVAMTPYAMTQDVTAILRAVANGQPGLSAMPDLREKMARIRQQAQAAQAASQPVAAVAQASPPPLPPVMIDGRTIPRQPQLVSVPPAVIPPVVPAPLPRDPAMPPALVAAPPAPAHIPPLEITPGPKCDACGNAVPEDLPKTNEMIICDACKEQGELEGSPLSDLVD